MGLLNYALEDSRLQPGLWPAPERGPEAWCNLWCWRISGSQMLLECCMCLEWTFGAKCKLISEKEDGER